MNHTLKTLLNTVAEQDERQAFLDFRFQLGNDAKAIAEADRQMESDLMERQKHMHPVRHKRHYRDVDDDKSVGIMQLK